MSKPRVAYLLQMFGIGGMPKWLFHLAQKLRSDFEFHFIATHSDYVMEQYKDVATVTVLPFNKLRIATYLLKNRIDIAQVANLRLYADAALLAGVPSVIERTDGLRGGVALGDKSGLDMIVASTRGVIPHLERIADPKKIRLIYNGVNVEEFTKIKPERFGFAKTDVIIGRTSRISGGKNISLLVRAVIEIRKESKYQHVRLVVCGGDNTQAGARPFLGQLKREAEPLGDSVVFTGEVFDPGPITLGYDIATCTSKPNNEGIPNSLIEAMAAGKPVVASAVDDIPELVQDGETGLLFSNDDLRALVEALKILIADADLRKKMGAAGRKRIKKDFALSTQVKKYADLYTFLLRQNGRHWLNRVFG